MIGSLYLTELITMSIPEIMLLRVKKHLLKFKINRNTTLYLKFTS